MVKTSAKKAAKAPELKMRQQKEEKERQAGNQEPVIEFDTIPETKDQEEEAVVIKEPIDSDWLDLDQEAAKEDKAAASEDEEQKAGAAEKEPVVEPIITKDLRVRLKLFVFFLLVSGSE
jgi:hypothetical protein